MHVDDWLCEPAKHPSEAYAKFVLDYFRKPAWALMAFEPWMGQYKLFCTYRDVRYRVTGASRLGDVWLTCDFDKSDGYEKRVDVAECKEWGALSDRVRLVD